MDETAEAVANIAARSHYLESWGDVQIKKGYYSLVQPLIKEIFDTKQLQSVLLDVLGTSGTYYEYVKAYWAADILEGKNFDIALQDGVFGPIAPKAIEEDAKVDSESSEEVVEETVAVVNVGPSLKSLVGAPTTGNELILYTKTGMGDGQMANNPWLQEFPDPISRVSWDNYLTISKADAGEEFENDHSADGGMNGGYAKVTLADGTSIDKVPVIMAPGQAAGTYGLALGYGRSAGLQKDMQTGVNAFELYKDFSNVQSASISKVDGKHQFACIQLHNTLMGRGDIIEATLSEFNHKDASEWNPKPHVSIDHQMVEASSVDIWTSFDRSIGHYFNMSIDLNACTGCGACVISCHAENNVPVVGKAEMRKSRDMHWLRIDRYFSSESTFEEDNKKKDGFSGLTGDNGSLGGFGELEDPSANPQVAFQPVMCQHCNHAPCETVCPVAATTHSRQGHNHMAYNRCVGTRYCANNCPYKVRRFNWFLYNNNDEFDYHMNNDLGKMVLNPDVNVRSRGVMEKCSFCIQSTQKVILDAKRDGRPVKDGEFYTACSSACSTGAIKFGDVNDPTSKITKVEKR